MMDSPLVVSALFVRPGRVGGAEFMLYALLEGLRAIEQRTHVLHLDTDPLASTAVSESAGTLSVHAVRARGNRFTTDQLVTVPYARQVGAHGMLFPNYFTPPWRDGLRAVSTIHDQQYRHLPHFFSPVKRAWLYASHAATLRTAHRVVAISNVVRSDLLDLHGNEFESRVITIPNPVSFARFGSAEPRDRTRAQPPYILSVASHYGHKNLGTLLRAFARLAPSVPHDLVLVGQRREHLVGVRTDDVDVDSLIATLGLSHRVRVTGHVSDHTVGAYYRGADLFVLPSLFEGFGMPAVEALGFGLPVITTRCGSLPEVTHGLAQLVDDPRSVDELSERMRTVLADPLAHSPSAEKVRWIRQFYAPERIARLYLDQFAD